MAECIERQEVCSKINELPLIEDAAMEILWAVDKIPTADVVPVVHGRWESIYQRDIYIPDEKTTMTLTEEKCSNCSIVTKFIGDKLFLHDFVCPNCGAKMNMDGEPHDP